MYVKYLQVSLLYKARFGFSLCSRLVFIMFNTLAHTNTHTLPGKMDFIIVRQHREEPVNFHVRDYYHCVHTTKDIVIPAKKSALIDTGVSFSFTSDRIKQ